MFIYYEIRPTASISGNKTAKTLPVSQLSVAKLFFTVDWANHNNSRFQQNSTTNVYLMDALLPLRWRWGWRNPVAWWNPVTWWSLYQRLGSLADTWPIRRGCPICLSPLCSRPVSATSPLWSPSWRWTRWSTLTSWWMSFRKQEGLERDCREVWKRGHATLRTGWAHQLGRQLWTLWLQKVLWGWGCRTYLRYSAFLTQPDCFHSLHDLLANSTEMWFI